MRDELRDPRAGRRGDAPSGLLARGRVRRAGNAVDREQPVFRAADDRGATVLGTQAWRVAVERRPCAVDPLGRSAADHFVAPRARARGREAQSTGEDNHSEPAGDASHGYDDRPAGRTTAGADGSRPLATKRMLTTLTWRDLTEITRERVVWRRGFPLIRRATRVPFGTELSRMMTRPCARRTFRTCGAVHTRACASQGTVVWVGGVGAGGNVGVSQRRQVGGAEERRDVQRSVHELFRLRDGEVGSVGAQRCQSARDVGRSEACALSDARVARGHHRHIHLASEGGHVEVGASRRKCAQRTGRIGRAYRDHTRDGGRNVDRPGVVAGRGHDNDPVLAGVRNRVDELGELGVGPVSRRTAESEFDDTHVDSLHGLRLHTSKHRGTVGVAGQIVTALRERSDGENTEAWPCSDHPPAVRSRAGDHRDVRPVVVGRDVVDGAVEH